MRMCMIATNDQDATFRLKRHGHTAYFYPGDARYFTVLAHILVRVLVCLDEEGDLAEGPGPSPFLAAMASSSISFSCAVES